jgi:hypothetical protein
LKYAILSGSNELITALEVERFILNYLRIITQYNKVNDYFSFRCPICYLPISFVHHPKTSHFKHVGSKKSGICPFYTGIKGGNFNIRLKNSVNIIRIPSDLFIKTLNCKHFRDWPHFKKDYIYEVFPTFFKKLQNNSISTYVFFWIYPIINFIENLNNKAFIDNFNHQLSNFNSFSPDIINVIFLTYYYIENCAQFKENYLFKYFINLKLIDVDYIIESNIRPSYFLPNNRVWVYSYSKDEILKFDHIPLNILNSHQFLINKFQASINPYVRSKLGEGIYFGYFDKRGNCFECNNPIHLALALPYKWNYNYRIIRHTGLKYKEVFQTFNCTSCSKELFSIYKWIDMVKSFVKNAREIEIGDKIEFITGDFEGKRGTILFKEQQDLIINVLLESKEEIKQSIFFAKRIQ